MVFIEVSEIIKQKSFFSVFVIILLSIIMTGAAFTASFLFQSVLLDGLRRYKIYDRDGKVIDCSAKSLVITHFICIIGVSLVITLFYQILKKW